MLRWYCVQARPRSVLYAKRNIDRLGFDTLLPTELRSWLVRGKRKEQLVPLFGNYIFVRFDTQLGADLPGWRRITTLPGVRSTPAGSTATLALQRYGRAYL